MNNYHKYCYKLFIFASITIVFYSNAFSQIDSSQYIITHKLFSVEDGLASREVFCGLQDANGFLWFGTRNGLNRFDGKNFLLFNQRLGGLRGNKVVQLATDNANHLFIEYGELGYSKYTNGIVDVMDLTTHEVKSFANTFPNIPFKENNIYWIANDGTDNLCFLTSYPFQLWNYSHKKGFQLRYEMKERDQLPKSNYYATTGGNAIFREGYAALIFDGIRVNYFITPDTVYKFISTNNDEVIHPITITPEKELIFTISNSIKKYYNFERLNKQFHLEKLPNFDKNHLYKKYGSFVYNKPSSNDFSFLINSYNKELYLRNDGHETKIIDSGAIDGFGNMAVYQHFIDSQGTRWISTSFGVIAVKMEKNRFQQYFTKKQQDIVKNNQVRGIYSDSSGKVYANVWNHLFVQDGNKMKSATINNELMYGLCKYQGRFYSSRYSLYIYDEKKNAISLISNTLNNHEIWALHPFLQNKLLLGRSDGIGLFDLATNTNTQVSCPNKSIPQAKFVYRFIKENNLKTWAVAENGLYVLDAAGTIEDYYGSTKDSMHHLPSINLLDLFIDHDGIFWIATNGEGLFRWDKSHNSFRQFNITNGFPSDILYRIESDKFNNLWISTDNGLVRFNTQNYRTDIYTTKDGISHNEFNRTSSFKATDGRLFFGGLNGVNAFYPEDFNEDTATFNAPLRIVSFNKFSGKKDLLINQTKELLQQNKIVLEPGDRFFTLEFILLDYENGKNSYAYKIQGIDKDWNYINENRVRISGLPYGEFVLEIKGQRNSGEWSTNELDIPVSVQSPLIRNLWFLMLLMFLFLLLVYIFFKWRTNQLSKSKKILEETVSERTNQLHDLLGQKEILLKEIHHRVKNNLQVISSLLELQSSDIVDEKAKAAITEGQNRVRSIALIHHRLYQDENLAAMELSGFIQELCGQIISVYFNSRDRIKLELNIPETNIDIDTVVPLGLIANEILTNSCKYAFNEIETGMIKINLESEGNGKFTLTFFDNGPGLSKDYDFSQSKSLGLRLIKRLSKQIGGNAEYHFDKGSVFVVKFKDTERRKSEE